MKMKSDIEVGEIEGFFSFLLDSVIQDKTLQIQLVLKVKS